MSSRDPLTAPPAAIASAATLELERGLVGACLLDPAAIPLVLACPTGVLTKDAHRDALEWIRASFTAGEQPDVARLTRALEQLGHANAAGLTASMLETAMLVPVAALPGYIRELRTDAVKRMLAQRGRAITLDALANGAGPSVPALLAELDGLREDAAAFWARRPRSEAGPCSTPLTSGQRSPYPP